MSDSFPYTKIQVINQFLKENNAAPLKKWGQNFLIDKNTIDIILSSFPSSSILDFDCIAEIGPGLGSITHRLKEIHREIFLFEIDPILIGHLKNNGYDRSPFHLIEGDVLKNLKHISDKNFFCFGNLPYYISSEILISLVNFCPGMIFGTFMLQKEFIQRITNENSSLSIYLNSFGKWKLIKNVPSSCFYPAPKAQSALVAYEKLNQPILSNKEKEILEILLRAFFWGKRKMISKNIKDSPFLEKWDRNLLYEVITKDGFLTGRERAEEIPRETYYTLSKNISSMNLIQS
jgi:16S rRNA (adenine1518-N6/adenine1519-N6)-dimethyltransferase